MNSLSLSIRSILFITAWLLTVVSVTAVAQKLPVKQEGSMRAPANVKIDGKATEWTFKAYNLATDVFYAMAHDDNNIYLVIKSADESSVRKIVSSGLTFIVNNIGKKNDTTGAKVTYPLFNYKNKPYINFLVKSAPADSADYITTANNKQFNSIGKFVRVRGIKDVDTLLSIYNTDGISVASSFDKEANYTYELAISRKHITPYINPNGAFFYKVIVNALQFDDLPGVSITRDPSGTITAIMVNKSNSRPNLNPAMNVETDFSGEYTLTR
ncbi:hypothetical protein ACFQZS_00130 [Mucilaginibacter calamicampi]|uniref:Uncharacterized protein n=1 Tax=Mucilaginibacter calamicampi TaxID=1302352 RepID=A0ABW2YTD1_9SPHI